MSEDLTVEQSSDGIVTMTLNRPHKRNAVSDQMIEAIEAACRRINGDMDVRCLIITGAGESFSSGGDLDDMRERRGHFSGMPVDARRIYRHGIQRIPLALQGVEVPMIAAVNGAAVGAGCDIALMCDMRIASDRATFAESFQRVGLISGDGGAWFLPRIVGPQWANFLTFTSEFIDATMAKEIGLVMRVVPHDTLMHEATKLAQRIVNQPPHAVRMNKRLLKASPTHSLDDLLELAATMQAAALQTEDHREAYTALMEKRTPVYKAR